MIGQLLLWCVFVPLCVSGVAFTLAIKLCPRDPPSKLAQHLGPALAIGGWCLAVAIALWGRQGFSWWPTEAWHSPIISCLLAGLALGFCQAEPERRRSLQWFILGLAMAWAAYMTMPSGEAWQDVLPLHRDWMFLIIVSGLSNVFWLQRLAEHSAERWVTLVALAGLAGSTILASTVYGGLAEWFLAACVSTLVAALLAIVWPEARLWTVVYPVTLFTVSGTASCRFYNYAEVSDWVYVTILFAPSLVALVDLPLRRQSVFKRTVLAFVVAVSILALVAWILLNSNQSEW